MKVELKTTEDASHTLYVPELDENYHSIHGAIQESNHVFIEAGLKQMKNRKVFSVFEVGLGTGLNALLTALSVSEHANVNYVCVEKYPLPNEITDALNFPNLLKGGKELFESIHSAAWNIETEIVPGFKLNKVNKGIEEFETSELFDLIYFDAFAPEKQPGMWTEEIFSKIVKLMRPGAVFTTYCAKGSVRRMLETLGLTVERLPGPPGKREMLRGIKH